MADAWGGAWGPAWGGTWAATDYFARAISALTGHVHIVELDASQRADTLDVVQYITTFGSLAFGELPDDDAISSALNTLRFSDTGFKTPTVGTLPNEYFDGRVVQPLLVSRALPVVPEQSRRVNLEIGAVEIVNTDGAFDLTALQYAIDGREVRVLFGLETFTYDNFGRLGTFRSAAWTAGFDRLIIEIRDQGYRLDIPLQTNFYAGTGGIEGTSELTKKPKPVCFGKCLNVRPDLIDPSNLVFQFHFRTAQAVDAVYDRGVALSFVSNAADYAALIAVSLSTGEYATCLALGLIRTGSSPSLLTADVRGDAAGSYVETTADIIERIMTDAAFGGLVSGDLNAASFTAFDTDTDGTIGWYRGADAILCSEAIGQICAGCAAWWGASRTGLFELGRLTEPDPDDVLVSFSAWEILDVERVPPPSGSFPPRWRQTVGCQKNWTVQRGGDVADSVSDARKQFLAEEFRLVSASDDDVRTDYALSKDAALLGSLFADSADAQVIADDLLALLSTQRETNRIVVGRKGYRATVGGTIAVTHPRVNGGERFICRVVDRVIDAAAQKIELIIWG